MGVRAAMKRAVTSLRSDWTSKALPVGGTETMRILVVNDDQNVLDTAKRLLTSDGYVAALTGAPQAALQIARSMQPSAIFLDVLMPGFDGWDLLAALKADPETCDIPVMMMCMLGERRKSLVAGAEGVIAKPLDTAGVRAAMASLASRQSSNR